MSDTVRYSESAKRAINDYLSTIADGFVVIAAGEELRREFRKLALNPAMGTAPTGPFELRPLYRFYVEAGDRRRLVQVTYRKSHDGIDILLFTQSPA